MKVEYLILNIKKHQNSYGNRTGYPPVDFWNKISASH